MHLPPRPLVTVYAQFQDEESTLIKKQTKEIIKKVYHIRGPLFFASAQNFVTHFTPKDDPDIVEIHFMDSSADLNDYSGLHALNVVGEKYRGVY